MYNSADGDNWTNNNEWKTQPLYSDGFAMPGTEHTWYKLWIGYPNGDRIFAKWYEASGICSGGSCSLTPDSELSNGEYEWYIKSWNDYGKIWSDGMDFTVSE